LGPSFIKGAKTLLRPEDILARKKGSGPPRQKSSKGLR